MADPSLVQGKVAVTGLYHGETTPIFSPPGSPFGRRSKKSACPVPAFLGPVNCCDVQGPPSAGFGSVPAFGRSDKAHAPAEPMKPEPDEHSRLLDKSLWRAEGSSRLKARGGLGQHLQTVGAMVVYPWLAFVVVTAAMAFMPPNLAARSVAWFVAVSLLIGSLVFGQVYMHTKVEIYKLVGLLGVLAVLLGVNAGRMIFDRNMLPYFVNVHRQSATGVVASQSTASFKDKGALEFVEGTRVDLRRSLGFRSPDEDPGTAYCVAPVMDLAAFEANEARYWAVGTDCCEPSWGFACGAALSSTARSGVVVRRVPTSSRASLRHHLFEKAVAQAGAMYRVGVPDDPVLVEWAEDAKLSVEGAWKRAAIYLVVLSLLYLMFSMVVAGFLHWRMGGFGASAAAGRRPVLPVMSRYHGVREF